LFVDWQLEIVWYVVLSIWYFVPNISIQSLEKTALFSIGF